MARRALSINDIKAYNPKILEFDGAWKDSIGCPELKGTWLVWGGSANGKTRFALQLAKYLCKFGWVVYDSLEEGLSLSLRMAILQVGMVDVRRRFTLLDKMRVNELREVLNKKKQSPNIVIIDSLQYTGMSYKEYQDLRDSFPNKLFIFISHADGRNPKGDVGKSVRYDANVKIYVEGYKAFPQSRYGGGEAFTIWQEGAEKYWT